MRNKWDGIDERDITIVTCTRCWDTFVGAKWWGLCDDCKALEQSIPEVSFEELEVEEPAGSAPAEAVVYFAQAGFEGPIKVGYTSGDATKRAKALQTGNAVEISIVGQIVGDRSLEKVIHQRLNAARIRGEWFERDAALAELGLWLPNAGGS